MGPSGCRKAVVLHHWLLLWNKRHGEASSWLVVSPECGGHPKEGRRGTAPVAHIKGKGRRA
jgi:hypothetical protein